MDLINMVLVFLVGVGASFIQRVSGFGMGIFAMLFLPHFMPSHTAATAISCLFSCGTTTYNSIKYRKHIPYRTVFPLVIAAMISIPIAVRYSVLVSLELFKVLLGVVLIGLSVYLFFFENRITIKPNVKNGIIAGAAGGILNGLFSTGGPPIVLYLTYAAADKMAYFAGLQFYFFLTNIYSTIVRAINGVFTLELVIYAAIGLIGCLIGDILGKNVFNKLNGSRLKKVIYAGMILSGIIMIL